MVITGSDGKGEVVACGEVLALNVLVDGVLAEVVGKGEELLDEFVELTSIGVCEGVAGIFVPDASFSFSGPFDSA